MTFLFEINLPGEQLNLNLIFFNLIFLNSDFQSEEWDAGIRGLTRGLATLQGTRKALMVKDIVGDHRWIWHEQVCGMWYFNPSVLYRCRMSDREGIWPVKTGCWFIVDDILTGALHILLLQLSPPPPSSLAPIKSRMEPFWYRLTWFALVVKQVSSSSSLSENHIDTDQLKQRTELVNGRLTCHFVVVYANNLCHCVTGFRFCRRLTGMESVWNVPMTAQQMSISWCCSAGCTDLRIGRTLQHWRIFYER